jgi:two-component system cell cycle sensor histidine kinase/response regulator CckA
MEVLTLWRPLYWLAAYVKGVTALASVATAVAFPLAVPRVLQVIASRNYKMLFEANPSLMWVFDPETTRFLAVNEAAVRTMGYSRSQFLSMTLEDISPLRERDKLWIGLEQARLSKAPEFTPPPTVLVTKDGRLIHVEIKWSRIKFYDREAYLALVLDTTERTEARDAVRKSESRYRSLVQAASQIVWTANPLGGFEEAQPSWCAFTGQSPEEARRDAAAAIHPDDRTLSRTAWESAVDEKKLFSTAYRLRRHDGVYRHVAVQAAPLLSERGELLEWIGCCTDVTEQRQPLEALRASEMKFRSLLESTPIGIFRSSTDQDRFHSVNPALVRMLGYDSEEEVLRLGLSQDVYMNPSDRQNIVYADLDRRVVEGEARSQWNVIVDWKKKDGDLLKVRLWVRETPDIPGTYEAAAEDITERSNLELELQQSQKIEIIGQLAGGVAHDFNNILMIISSYHHMLRERVGGDLAPYSDEIANAVERAAATTRQLLAFGRKQRLAPKVLALDTLIRDELNILVRLLPANIQNVWSLNTPIWPVMADPGQISQVLLNLVLNARDAMPEGGTLEIAAEDVVWTSVHTAVPGSIPAGSYVCITVRDSGSGIPPEVQRRVFEPFFTTKEVGKGTGLGLSTVLGILKQSRSYITLESKPGDTAFRVYIPRHYETTKPEKAPEVREIRGSECVLVVEDEVAALRGMREFLETHGYKVWAASNAMEAMDIAAKEKGIQALVTDMVMPGISGRELAEKMLENDPQLKIIFISGYSDWGSDPGSKVVPGSRFLQKPFALRTLAETLREAFDSERRD